MVSVFDENEEKWQKGSPWFAAAGQGSVPTFDIGGGPAFAAVRGGGQFRLGRYGRSHRRLAGCGGEGSARPFVETKPITLFSMSGPLPAARI